MLSAPRVRVVVPHSHGGRVEPIDPLFKEKVLSGERRLNQFITVGHAKSNFLL